MPARLPALACVAALVLGAGALAACGDDDETVSADTTVTASPPTTAGATTTAPPATTATTGGATTTTAAPACGGSPIPGGAVSVSGATGDFDGDGSEDTLTTYGEDDPSNPPPWHLHLDQGSGGAVDVVIVDATNPAMTEVRPLGGSEISARAGLPPDGSGVEAFVAIDRGASVEIVAVYQFQACDLVRINAPGGTSPESFAVGASVTHYDGLRCEGVAGGARLVQLSARSGDGVTYDTAEEVLDVQGGAFVSPNPPVQGTLTSSDPTLPDFATIACPGVTYP